VKKKMQFWLLILCMFSMIGCTAQEEGNSEEEKLILSDTGNNQVVLMDFQKMFPYEQGETLKYTGTAEYARTDTVERVDKILSPEPYTLYMVEQEVEDMSGGELGDTTSLYQLKVSEDQVSYFYKEGLEQILIQKPIALGNTWKTIRLDDMLGFVPVVAEITEIENDNITVSFVLDATIEQADAYDRFQSVTFKSDLGIIREQLGEGDVAVERILSKTTSSPDATYISRYVSPKDLTQTFYKGNEIIRYVEDANLQSQLWKEDVSDSQRYSTYETYLNHLDRDDLRNLSRAKKMLTAYMLFTNEDFQLVESFTSFYEGVMMNLSWDLLLINTPNNTYLYDEIYTYDAESNQIVVRLTNEITDPALRAIAGVFKKNGIGIVMLEGDPYFQASGDFLMRGIAKDDAKIETYLAYKAIEFDAFPIFSEGYLLKSADQIGDLLYEFENAYRTYQNDDAFEEAKYYADYFFEVFVVPTSYEYEENKYVGGYIHTSFLEAYKSYIKTYPDSTYTAILENVLSLLEKNNGRYSTSLNDYLNDLGYEAALPSMTAALLQEKEFNSIVPVAIASKPSRSSTVTVDSLQMLLENIKPDTELILSPGLYSFSEADEYESEYAVLKDGILMIRNIEGLTVRGEGNQPVDLMANGYMEVLSLKNVSDVVIENLRVGHRYTYCVGNVINLIDSDAIWIDHVILYGCGYRGIETTRSNNVVISNALISDCQASALTMVSSQKIAVMNTLIKRNGEQVIQATDSSDIRFEDVTMSENTVTMYEGQQGKFKIDNTEGFTFLDNVTYDSVAGQRLIEGNGEIIINEE